MHGQNLLFNQPMAIDKNYLLSMLPDLIYQFQNRNGITETSMSREKLFLSSLRSQIDSLGKNESSPVIFNIRGPIIKYSTWYQIGTQTMINWLRMLDTEPSVSGILFNIDSGGGMVAGTPEFVDTIRDLTKPTIAYTNGVQASAAQWIASGCDYQMAGEHADTLGSIGTFLSFQDFSALFEKYGAKIYEVYAPESTLKNMDYRELMKGNEKPYEKYLSEITQKFIQTIQTNIPDLKDDDKVFKGEIYNAEEALEIGLIQEIGTIEQALSKF